MSVSECNELPVGDLVFLKQLTEKAGASIVQELVACAPISIEQELTAIEAAFNTEDADALKSSCHALKGACYSVQMLQLACLTEKMDQLHRDLDEAVKILPNLKTACNEAVVWWHHVLEEELYLP
ncbi:MAG: Hpt domain-containing protein [Sneathiella sp.]